MIRFKFEDIIYMFDPAKKNIISEKGVMQYKNIKNMFQWNTLYIKFNEKCNMHCIYCFQSHVKNETEYNIERFDDILDKLVSESNRIILFGGEPLLSININKISYLISKFDKEFDVFTNGCFDNCVLDFILCNKEKFGIFVISLDGPKKIHDKRRKILNESSYDLIMRNVEQLLSAGLKVDIQINIDTENMNSTQSLIDYIANRFEQRDILTISMNKVLHTEKTISEIELLELYKSVKEKNNTSIQITVNSKTYLKVLSVLTDNGYIRQRCDIGFTNVVDLTQKKIYSCPENSNTEIGIIKNKSISWDHKKINTYKKYSFKEQCHECIYIDFCSKGCYVCKDTASVKCKLEAKEILEYLFKNFNVFFAAK